MYVMRHRNTDVHCRKLEPTLVTPLRAAEVQLGKHEWLKRARVGHKTRTSVLKSGRKQLVSRIPSRLVSSVGLAREHQPSKSLQWVQGVKHELDDSVMLHAYTHGSAYTHTNTQTQLLRLVLSNCDVKRNGRAKTPTNQNSTMNLYIFNHKRQ